MSDPKPGEVWGVPTSRPTNWRYVRLVGSGDDEVSETGEPMHLLEGEVAFRMFEAKCEFCSLAADWAHWVKYTGAVCITKQLTEPAEVKR